MGASSERHSCLGVKIQRIVNYKTIKCVIGTYSGKKKDIADRIYLFYENRHFKGLYSFCRFHLHLSHNVLHKISSPRYRWLRTRQKNIENLDINEQQGM